MKKIIKVIILSSYMMALDLNYSNFEANFTQKITNEKNLTIEYKGDIFSSKDDILIWNYKEPVQKTIYYTNDKVIIVEPDLEQVIYTKINNIPKINDILSSSTNIKGNYYVSKFRNKSIFFELNTDDLLKVMSYQDEINNNIEINFSEVKVDTNRTHTIDIPEDFDVIYQ